MKKDTHPQYFPNATITCACGAVYHLGSTKENMSVEICAACHPLYTGQEKTLDTAGRVERFKARQSGVKTKAAPKKKAATKK
jgi:large subunit ribosomal protein L31